MKINGEFYEITEAPKLDKKFKQDIDVVVDRLVVKGDLGNRLAESIETALGLADGHVPDRVRRQAVWKRKPARPRSSDAEGILQNKNETHERLLFSQRFACPVSGFTIEEIEPRLFSFNAPAGACPKCDGLGTQLKFEPDLVVPEPERSLDDGAISPWSRAGAASPYYAQTLEAIARHFKVSVSTPWEDLPEKVRNVILFGSGDETIRMIYEDGVRRYETEKTFEGVIGNIERRWKETDSAWVREELSRYQGDHPCDVCNGYRLKPQSLAVKIGGLHVGEVCAMSIKSADAWFREIPQKLSKQQNEIAVRVLKEIRDRLRFLNDVGLDYLTLARNSGTLSGGESQRIRLASQIGSGLTGVLYVLDEPSIGLHQKDNERLLVTLKRLRDLGNTVIVVEHDEDAILMADHVVDIGPGAGIHGGEIIAQGTPQDVMDTPESLTGQYLSGERQIAIPKKRRERQKGRDIRIVGARGNNLKNVSVDIPLALFTCVTGVSGGGKSTLLIDTLFRAVCRKLNNSREHPDRARPHRGPGTPRQDHRHRPVPDRAHTALQPRHLHRRLHADPRLVRGPARSQGARLRARAASRSTSRAAAASAARATA